MNPPYYDRSKHHDIEWLHNHEIQKHFALFVSRPQLYAEITNVPDTDKQDYMFYCFHKMLFQYYHFNCEKQYDEIAYFGSLSQDKAGAANISGGGDTKSRSRDKMASYKQSQTSRKTKMEYLMKKYGISFKDTDPRSFIGHKEPWKHLSPALLEKNGWQWVIDQSYSDETFTTPFPAKLDSSLIPLHIRNKTLQKWKTARNNSISPITITHFFEDEEEKKEEPPLLPKTQPITTAFSEEDLKVIMEEGW